MPLDAICMTALLDELRTVLEGGKIAAAGKHDELLKTSDIYREVYESQVKGGEE